MYMYLIVQLKFLILMRHSHAHTHTHTHTNIHRIHTKVLLGLASWIEQYVSKLVGLKFFFFEFRNQITDKMQNITQ